MKQKIYENGKIVFYIIIFGIIAYNCVMLLLRILGFVS